MSNETSHHKWERGIIYLLNLDGWDLEWTGEEFEHFDARGKTPKGFDCVIEFKLRHAYYPTKVLEKYKSSYCDPSTWEFFFVGYFADAYDAHTAACDHMQQHNPQIPCKRQPPFSLSQP